MSLTAIKNLNLINGKLPNHQEGYPVFYMDKKDNCLCPDCANESHADPDAFEKEKPQGAAVNWESELYCDRCSEKIEAAYSDDEE
jgi:hypothetical protein